MNFSHTPVPSVTPQVPESKAGEAIHVTKRELLLLFLPDVDPLKHTHTHTCMPFPPRKKRLNENLAHAPGKQLASWQHLPALGPPSPRPCAPGDRARESTAPGPHQGCDDACECVSWDTVGPSQARESSHPGQVRERPEDQRRHAGAQCVSKGAAQAQSSPGVGIRSGPCGVRPRGRPRSGWGAP